jgi:hypothetical protein
LRIVADLMRDRLLRMQSATPDDIRIKMTNENRQPVLTVTVSVQVERAGLIPSDM